MNNDQYQVVRNNIKRVSDWINKLPIPTTGATAMMIVLREAQDALDAAQPADHHETVGLVEMLDTDNHRLRRTMQKLMARLADLLDEDQFAECELLVASAGVAQPASPAKGEVASAPSLNLSNRIAIRLDWLERGDQIEMPAFIKDVREMLCRCDTSSKADHIGDATDMIGKAEASSDAAQRDWPEDFAYENGHYWCKCWKCNQTFFGHKRRIVCKVCDAAPSAAPAQQEPEDDVSAAAHFLRRKHAIAQPAAQRNAIIDFDDWFRNTAFPAHVRSTKEQMRISWNAAIRALAGKTAPEAGGQECAVCNSNLCEKCKGSCCNCGTKIPATTAPAQEAAPMSDEDALELWNCLTDADTVPLPIEKLLGRFARRILAANNGEQA